MLKELKVVSKIAKKSGLFIGGVAFGTVGLNLLTSKEAKKGYSHVISKILKVRDGADSMLSNVKQHADDIYADATDIYEKEKKDLNLEMVEAVSETKDVCDHEL